jgi:tRNA-dependent cyclodipeptide synthase
MSTDGIYRIKTTPTHSLPEFQADRKCLYTVSIPQHHTIGELVAAYRWTLDRFSECAVLLGDGLYRHTLCALRGLDPPAAMKAASESGDDLLREFAAEFGRPLNRVIRCTELMTTEAFHRALGTVMAFHDRSAHFAEALARDAEAFTRRQALHGRLAVPEATATAHAVKYLQEEVAVYLALARDGWLTDVYLGEELPTLARIMKHQIDDAPEELARRINISLHARVAIS